VNGKRILSVSYDQSLLATRHKILQYAGFEVVSAYGFMDGIQHSQSQKFDLAIIGHSIPTKDSAEIVKTIKQHCRCPILSIRREGYAKISESDYSVDAIDGPQALISAVESALRSAESPASS
jgi:DNA-binding response OmpR family regulator